MSIESVMPFNHLILCHPFLWLSIFPSIRVSSSESALHIRWPKYWSIIFSISPSNEYLGFISFRIDWFDLFEVQGTLRSLPHHHNLKASSLQHSAFFMVQLSHPYMTTRKTTALTICWLYAPPAPPTPPKKKKKCLLWVLILHVIGIFSTLNHTCSSCSDSRLHHFSWRSGAPTRHSLPQYYSFGISSCSGYISPFYSFLPDTKSKYSSLAPYTCSAMYIWEN